MSPVLTAALTGCPLDRSAHLRAEDGAIDRLRARADARVLPVWRGKPLIALAPVAALDWRRSPLTEALFLGMAGETPHFAADVSYLDEGGAMALGAPGKFIDLRAISGDLGGPDAATACYAKALLEWHAQHMFCARCGGRSVAVQGGWRRDCGACGAPHFPRTDPVVIMLVTNGGRAVLATKPQFPDRLASVIAGFLEPGESIEEAVRRETLEELGLRAGPVRYLCSQPWPNPSQLMIGCHATTDDTDLVIDREELSSAFWVTREEMRAAFGGKAGFDAPIPMAIAHTLLRAWADGQLD